MVIVHHLWRCLFLDDYRKPLRPNVDRDYWAEETIIESNERSKPASNHSLTCCQFNVNLWVNVNCLKLKVDPFKIQNLLKRIITAWCRAWNRSVLYSAVLNCFVLFQISFKQFLNRFQTFFKPFWTVFEPFWNFVNWKLLKVSNLCKQVSETIHVHKLKRA